MEPPPVSGGLRDSLNLKPSILSIPSKCLLLSTLTLAVTVICRERSSVAPFLQAAYKMPTLTLVYQCDVRQIPYVKQLENFSRYAISADVCASKSCRGYILYLTLKLHYLIGRAGCWQSHLGGYAGYCEILCGRCQTILWKCYRRCWRMGTAPAFTSCCDSAALWWINSQSLSLPSCAFLNFTREGNLSVQSLSLAETLRTTLSMCLTMVKCRNYSTRRT